MNCNPAHRQLEVIVIAYEAMPAITGRHPVCVNNTVTGDETIRDSAS